LHYYNKANEKNPLKTVNCDRCGAREAMKEVGKEQKNCVEIFRVDGDAVMKPHYTFVFYCDSPQETYDWIQAINQISTNHQ